jgi:hypothetical protein
MTFADPQSVTISGTAHSLPRVAVDGSGSTYSKDDGTVQFAVSQAYGKRNRRTVKIVHSKNAPDPLFPTQNTPYSMTCYVTVDVPKVGYTIAEQKAVVDGFITNLNATSGANITKLLGGEN